MSRPGLESTLCWSDTAELDHSATTIPLELELELDEAFLFTYDASASSADIRLASDGGNGLEKGSSLSPEIKRVNFIL